MSEETQDKKPVPVFRETGFRKPKPGEDAAAKPAAKAEPPKSEPKEIGGPPGPEPTRYGDWAFKGRVTDF
ncbi:DUF1674 domain-containing protein [Oceanibaculum pacificum]|uniref:DUF1674 domain-containing protein n=1 Tax=Oceanibaculum pacificum TaxID=580166 RepID=A0A154WG49_9PROT|nr:DUF1674 domain-containing protein [Oceanibaculum pacificum]KZD12487.1 hypothetical protein AUP43_16260 [Oceanibaculum pacificum]